MTEEQESAKEEATPEPNTIKFPEDKIQGQGFSQYDQKTGWLWVGLKLPAFTFRTAWAFIRSQEFLISQAFDGIENARIQAMNIARGGKPNGALANVLANLRKKH